MHPYLEDGVSTHTPLAGRDYTDKAFRIIENVSTHTPLAGRDALHPYLPERREAFLLTRPLRDVTRIVWNAITIPPVSTHTPLAGRDNPETLS